MSDFKAIYTRVQYLRILRLGLQLFMVTSISTSILGCSEPKLTNSTFKGQTMGTFYDIKVAHFPLTKSEQSSIHTEIERRLEQINDQMSTYRSNSELSRFNLSQAVNDFPVSEGTANVVAESIRIHKITSGAFDITLGPLVNLWGFGPDKLPQEKPTTEMIKAAQSRVAIEHLSNTENTLSKNIDALYIDLSGIAKGYGADVISEYLESLGIENYIVGLGGDLRAKGINASNISWQIAIEKASTTEHSVQHVVAVGNNAIVTSGSYRNYYDLNDERFSHTIDPITGQPTQHNLVSVTVIHPSAMTADGFATAFMAMGKEKGIKLASQKQLAVYMIYKSGDHFKEVYTEAFSPFFQK
ncbi:FAD:protein FMN transferase [Moritella sp. 5]|uniref:FAD:protein FMN transferase n=1 Tax=Moritella sp. 5 TaxID=2746231 RepID=UPI001BA8DB98|nr:FAD:protein FMN transferase [Moritella sp. 5]QUM80133.1 FAD:protein FMN transferase [Moritella sp. 5]